jgi:acetolactate synthase I/II/III large subunit
MSQPEDQVATVSVGEILAEALARAGVKIAFTVPGESVLGLLEGLVSNHVRVVAARHEGAAAFMAAAVGGLTGRPGVCIATRGPGAANLAIGLQTARADSAPVIAIVGQVNRDVIGREAFQEMDLVRTFEPVVKWAGEIHEASEAEAMVEKAILAAVRGRPGPVLLSVPADLLDESVTVRVDRPHATATVHPEHHAEPDPTLVRKVLHLLTDARRPVIIAGAGVLRARSTDALVRFAEQIHVPVIASWRRPDVFPNDNPLYLGVAGYGASPTVRARLEEADAILVLGCRLNEITTYGYKIPAASTRWAHVDLEPRSPTSEHRADIVMAADAAAFLRVAQRVLVRAAFDAASLDERKLANAVDRAAFEAAAVVGNEPWEGGGVHPGHAIATLARLLPPESILATDAGDFGTWAARGFRFHRPGTFLGPTSGAMGYGLPAAVAASLARPGRLAVALAGDGGFAMTMAELETAVRERAHVVAIVFDNGRYGTIWRHQARRGAPGLATRLGHVDFAAVATACGALGLAVDNDEDFEAALAQALEAGRPAVIHLTVDPHWTTPDELPGSQPEPAAEVEVEVVTVVDGSGEVVEVDVVEIAEVAGGGAPMVDESAIDDAIEALVEDVEAEAVMEEMARSLAEVVASADPDSAEADGETVAEDATASSEVGAALAEPVTEPETAE